MINNILLCVKNRFILFFLLTSIFIFFLYSYLGTVFYSKIVPFYDSLSYQLTYKKIYDSYLRHGYLDNTFELLHPTTSFLSRILIIILVPILPSLPIGLYVVLYLFGVWSLFNIQRISYLLTKSLTKSYLVIFFLFSLNLFSYLIYGILDQKLDFIAALFFLSVIFSAYLFFKKPSRYNYLSLLIQIAILFLFRPIIIIPLISTLIGFLVIEYQNLRTILRIVLKKENLLFVFFGLLLIIVIVLPSLSFLHNYYFIWNIDLGVNAPLLKVIINSFYYLYSQIGLLSILIIIFLAVIKFKHIKHFLLLLFCLIPFFVSKSTSNQLIYYPVSFLLVFIFFRFIRDVTSREIINFFFFTTLILSLINLLTLTSSVFSVNSHERKVIEEIVKKLSRNKNKIYISSTAPIGVSMVALDELYGRSIFKLGKNLFHITDFKGYKENMDKKEVNKLIELNLKQICDYKGYYVMLDGYTPTFKDHYIYTFRIQKKIKDLINRMVCMKKTMHVFKYEDNYYTIYEVL